MSNPQPALTGTLEATPLVNLLVYALDHRLHGTLVFEQDDGRKHAVFLDEGAPAKVRLADPELFLGQVLVRLGKLSQADCDRTLEQAAANDVIHGSLLLSQGLVDEDTLKEGLREQLIQKVDRLATLPPSVVWGYYDRVNYLERYGPPDSVRAKPLALIWRLVQKHADRARVDDIVTRIGTRVLKLHLDAPVLRFQFGRQEQAVIEVLRAKPQPYAELMARDLVDPQRLSELVYMLAVTRQLELGAPDMLPLGSSEPPSSSKVSAPPVAPPPAHGVNIFRSASPPPSSARAAAALDPEQAAFRNELEQRLARSDDTYYQLLGVAENADAATIHQSYLALAKKWHPDRLGAEFADVRDQVTRLFSRMSEAQQTLCDPVKREEYDQKGQRAEQDTEEAEHVQRVLRAATAFQRAEILLKRNNLPQAEEEARSALSDDPSQPEYRALLAWLEAQKPGADISAAIAVLDKVLTQAPNDNRARWYRGQLYKRTGKDNRAIRDFRAIVESEPRHVDAQREIRLYDMRNTGGRSGSDRPSDAPGDRASRAPDDKPRSPEGGPSGLFKRIFKR